MLKSPFDLAIYCWLIGRVGPRTIIEIGSKAGGSALWFADMLTAHGIDGSVVSVDLAPPSLVDPRIRFLAGDALDLRATLDDGFLAALPRPFLVTEDSAHTFDATIGVLRALDPSLAVGDRIVVEDGILAQFSDARYRRYEDGPNRAVAAFLAETGDRYAIDTEACDMFGTNYTWNPNGWLQRVA
jgi:cephalosporin hydroxylase